MSIRFTETNKWDDKWFRNLSLKEKVMFQFLCDKCDNAGFYEVDIEDISFRTKIEKDDVLGAIKGLNKGYTKIIINGEWFWIKNFLRIQKNLPLNPDNNSHKQIIFLLKSKIGLFPNLGKDLGATEGLISPPGKGKGISKGKGNAEKFKIFWKEYPKKKAKAKAEISFDKLKLENGLFEKIIIMLNQQKLSEDWIKENGKYIPYPSTWINQKRWEDEDNIPQSTYTPSPLMKELLNRGKADAKAD